MGDTEQTQYQYEALSPDGKKALGLVAGSATFVAETLDGMGYRTVALRRYAGAAAPLDLAEVLPRFLRALFRREAPQQAAPPEPDPWPPISKAPDAGVRYRATGRSGRKVSGTAPVASVAEAARHLEGLGYVVDEMKLEP